MNLFRTEPSQSSNRSAISPQGSQATSAVLVIFILVFPILILGGSAAIFPASFNIKLGLLIGGIFVLVLALMAPLGARAPSSFMMNLLFALAFVWVIWPVYLGFQGLPGPNINPTRIIYWAFFCLGVFWLIASKSFRQQLSARIGQSRPFFILLFVYLAWAILSAIISREPFFSVYYFIKLMIGPTAILVIALACVGGKNDVDKLFFWMVLAALAACLLGSIEAIKKGNLFFDLVPSLFPQGDDAAEWAESLVRDKSRDGTYRIMSTFSHPLTFGEYLVLTFPLAAYLGVFGANRWYRIAGVIALPSILLGVYLTHTRSNVAALGAVLVCLIGFYGLHAVKQKRSFAASILGTFSIVALVFGVIALLGLLSELMVGRTAAETGSTMARVIMLQRGGTLALEQPLFGYGPGRAAITIGFLPGITSLTIDNQYLSVALESGLIGLALYLGLMAYPVFKALRVASTLQGEDQARIIVIACALIGFTLIKSVLSQTENFDKYYLLVALLFVLTGAELNKEQQAGTVPQQAPFRQKRY